LRSQIPEGILSLAFPPVVVAITDAAQRVRAASFITATLADPSTLAARFTSRFASGGNYIRI
jgi:hypothetical protein